MNNVIVAVVVRNNQVAMVRRAIPEDTLIWQFPAGKVEGEETQENAVVREVREEIGLICRPRKKLGERLALESSTKLHYWICDYMSGQICVNSPREVTDVRWVSRKGALKLITSNVYEPLKKFLLHASEE